MKKIGGRREKEEHKLRRRREGEDILRGAAGKKRKG